MASGSVLSPDYTAAEVAEYCMNAFMGRHRLLDVVEEMTQAGVIRSGPQAAAVYHELRSSLVSSSGSYPEAESWLKRLTEDFADGRIGTGTGPEFRSLAAQSMIKDIELLEVICSASWSAGKNTGCSTRTTAISSSSAGPSSHLRRSARTERDDRGGEAG